jgi:hypothetical protein
MSRKHLTRQMVGWARLRLARRNIRSILDRQGRLAQAVSTTCLGFSPEEIGCLRNRYPPGYLKPPMLLAPEHLRCFFPTHHRAFSPSIHHPEAAIRSHQSRSLQGEYALRSRSSRSSLATFAVKTSRAKPPPVHQRNVRQESITWSRGEFLSQISGW